MSNSKKQAYDVKSDCLQIRNYPGTLIHEHKSDDGSVFHSVSFRFRDAWASFIPSEDEITQSSDKSNSERFDLTLGDPDDIRNVSIKKENEYIFVPMFNRTILSTIKNNRYEYLKSIAIQKGEHYELRRIYKYH